MVEAEVKHCLPCQVGTRENTRAPLKMSKCPEQPWTHVSADFCGSLPPGEYLLVVVDEHSRYPAVEITHSTSARSTIPHFDKIFACHGIPEVVKTDNGPPFNSSDFRGFAGYLGFKHRRIMPEWPAANGEAERFMRTLKKNLHTSESQRKPWKQELWKFLRQYRATPHSSTKVAPAEALFHRNIRTELPSIQSFSKEDIRKNVLLSDKNAKNRMKRYADKRRRACKSNICVGDTVILQDPHPRKLDPPYYPKLHEVVKRKGDMVTATHGSKPVTRNISRFKAVDARYQSQDMSCSESDGDVIPNPTGENEGTRVESDQNSQTEERPLDSSSKVHRARERHRPAYLKDYVT
ncbi:PREDICTED: uncharacterized protein K02A2.6-like [Priapulus caudatus]|uniref:Uncharacterized protein K02A2.6-like n=1 Tax=Priapulus caudatus TaxID=37621 RepID=A0ABM1EM59_PRICU|nr:PREDICTED: uncharacterized protein K02A2.6-like [Priapulus caudatus]